MIFLSRPELKVDRKGNVRIGPRLARHAAKLDDFLREIGERGFSVRLRDGRYHFSGTVSARSEQKIRNFLVNECPLSSA